MTRGVGAAVHYASGEHGERRLTLLQGILPFDRSRLGADVLAGVTLAAIGIPEVMGYTKIIGTPVVTGLYTMLLPMVAFALLGASRHLVVSADSATAAIVAAGLTSFAFVAESPRYVAMTSLVAIAAAGMLFTARVLRVGFLADFLSRTVLVGFLSGVGVQVAFGQLHGMLGLPASGSGFLEGVLATILRVPEAHVPTLLLAGGVVALIAAGRALTPRIPAALLAVIGAIAASTVFDLGSHGIALVGAVPSGLPPLGLPDVSWRDLRLVLPIAGSCFVVILAQSAATSRAYAVRYRERVHQDGDLVGLSLANVAAGCTGTFVVNGSPTKTAIVDSAGGRSQIAHVTAAVTVLLVLLFLTGPLAQLPSAVLAAIVFMVGVQLVDHRGLAEIHREQRGEFWLAVITAATVVVAGVEQGILLAVVLSLLQHVRRSYRPHTAIVMRDAEDRWRMDEAVPGRMIEPGLVMFWFGAELFYANAGHFVAQVRRLVDESPSPVRCVIVDAGAITSIDFTAGHAVLELEQELASQGVVLALARVNPRGRADYDRMGLTAAIGAERMFTSRHDALRAFETGGLASPQA